MVWQDAFGFADSYDETTGRYLGLRGGMLVNLSDAHSPALVVKPDVALKQMDAERKVPEPSGPGADPGDSMSGGAGTGDGAGEGIGSGGTSGAPGGSQAQTLSRNSGARR